MELFPSTPFIHHIIGNTAWDSFKHDIKEGSFLVELFGDILSLGGAAAGADKGILGVG